MYLFYFMFISTLLYSLNELEQHSSITMVLLSSITISSVLILFKYLYEIKVLADYRASRGFKTKDPFKMNKQELKEYTEKQKLHFKELFDMYFQRKIRFIISILLLVIC